MLFILVKSLDEVRWQCGVYGHHVFGRRSTQARSSVTAGRCTSCPACRTRAARERLALERLCWRQTAARGTPPRGACVRRPARCRRSRAHTGGPRPSNKRVDDLPKEALATFTHTDPAVLASGTCCAPCRMLRHAPRSDSANVRSRPLSLIMRSRTTRNAAAPRSPTGRTKTGAP